MANGLEAQTEQWLLGTIGAVRPGTENLPGNLALVEEFDRRYGTRFGEGGVTADEWETLKRPGAWINAINADPETRAQGVAAGVDAINVAIMEQSRLGDDGTGIPFDVKPDSEAGAAAPPSPSGGGGAGVPMPTANAVPPLLILGGAAVLLVFLMRR